MTNDNGCWTDGLPLSVTSEQRRLRLIRHKLAGVSSDVFQSPVQYNDQITVRPIPSSSLHIIYSI